MNTTQKSTRTLIAPKLFCSLIIFLIPLLFFGQKIEVSGIIIDAVNKSPLPGVSVILKNSNKGSTSDFNGKFQIDATTGDVLIFSYMGFTTVEKKVVGTTLNVTLQEDAQELDEVVLIGYGSTRKKDLTGAVAQVDYKEFQQGFVTNAEGLIANKVPGVQITPVSGKPGAGSSFLLRGGASLSASNNPLFVIDGVPIGLEDGPGVLSALNPDDIAAFSVLKDASAAAIYGSRGSNGVIIISTKRGGSGDLKISLTTKASISSNIYNQNVLTGDQYREVAKEASLVSGVSLSDFNLGTSNTDWQNQITRSAITQNHNLSLGGGAKNLTYYASFGAQMQQGILKNTCCVPADCCGRWRQPQG